MNDLDFVRDIARGVAGERNAWQYVEDLIGAGCEKLAEITADRPHYLPFCRKRLEGAMLDWLRKECRHEHGEMIEMPAVVQTTTEQQIQEHERRSRLKAAVIELPVKDRLLMERRYRDGLTQQQVADEMQIGQQRVSQIERRILRRLKPAVEVAEASLLAAAA